MDAAAFEQVYEAFGEFHSVFAPAVRAQGVAGPQPELSPGPLGAVPRPAQRRESLRISGGPGPGPAALPHPPPLGMMLR